MNGPAPVFRLSLRDALLFIALYLVVDWATFFYDTPALNFTPWNPPAGLNMALLIVHGAKAVPTGLAALLLGDVVVRGLTTPNAPLLLSNLGIIAGYAAAAEILRRRLRLDPTLARLADLVRLMVAVAVAAAPVSLAFAVPYTGSALSYADLPALVAQYWLGDVIGILSVTPLVLVLIPRLREKARLPTVASAETVLQAMCVVLALMVVFNPLVPEPAKLFYLLYPAVIWIAMRRGLVGATLAIIATQVGLVAALHLTGKLWEDLAFYQTLMLTLTVSGLMIGGTVSERRRLETDLQARRAELARVSRLNILGEMASSLAHELNQPLFTTMSYTKAARQMMLAGGSRDEIDDLMGRAVAEAERASGVLRSIRNFLRHDQRQEAISLPAVIAEIMVLAKPDAHRAGIAVTVDLPDELPEVWGDKVQIEQVLLNLLRNSIDALAALPDGPREIHLAAGAVNGRVEISVTDNGPGVPPERVPELFDPFFTTKPSGMGLGLPICRSIVESLGGNLWLDSNGPEGARFCFTLPTAAAHD